MYPLVSRALNLLPKPIFYNLNLMNLYNKINLEFGFQNPTINLGEKAYN